MIEGANGEHSRERLREVIEKTNAEHSRERLRELYRDGVGSGFRVPEIPAVKLIVIISLITLIALAATMLYKFNTFIMMQEDVFAKRGHLEGAYQRRVNLFENLLTLTLNHAELEREVFTHVADVRKDIIKKLELPPEVQKKIVASLNEKQDPTIADLGKTLSSLNSNGLQTSMGRLLGLVEQYPNVKSAETYMQMMQSLTQIEDRIAERRMVFQETVLMFNREISRFPWYLLARATKFKRFDYFEAENAAHHRPLIKTETFDRLLPMMAGENYSGNNASDSHGTKGE